jgi:diguanylate cyclase (GGDEF)-like protein
LEADTESTLDQNGPRALTERKRQHRAFVIARIILVALFIGFWFTLTPVGYPLPYGFLIALVAEMGLLLGCLAWLKQLNRPRALDAQHGVLLLGELVCHSTMFFFLGGVSWLGSIAFIYAIVYAAVFLTWKQAAFFTTLVCAIFIGIVAADATGTIGHQVFLPQGPDRYKDMDYLVPTVVSFIGVMGTLTFWMVFLGSELRRERDIAMRAYDQLRIAQTELRKLNDELEAKVEERTKVLAFRAEHDSLTGLLNRGSITRRCQEVLAQASRSGQKVAVIVADGDDFKSCNDRVGHAYGDTVLRSLADALRETARESDYVGRLGGDEFLVVLPNTSTMGAARFCRRLIKSLDCKRGEFDEGLPFPALSLGIAIYPDYGTQVDELTRVADHAMYQAKAVGGARWRLGGADQPVPARHDEEPVPSHAGVRQAV